MGTYPLRGVSGRISFAKECLMKLQKLFVSAAIGATLLSLVAWGQEPPKKATPKGTAPPISSSGPASPDPAVIRSTAPPLTSGTLTSRTDDPRDVKVTFGAIPPLTVNLGGEVALRVVAPDPLPVVTPPVTPRSSGDPRSGPLTRPLTTGGHTKWGTNVYGPFEEGPIYEDEKGNVAVGTSWMNQEHTIARAFVLNETEADPIPENTVAIVWEVRQKVSLVPDESDSGVAEEMPLPAIADVRTYVVLSLVPTQEKYRVASVYRRYIAGDEVQVEDFGEIRFRLIGKDSWSPSNKYYADSAKKGEEQIASMKTTMSDVLRAFFTTRNKKHVAASATGKLALWGFDFHEKSMIEAYKAKYGLVKASEPKPATAKHAK